MLNRVENVIRVEFVDMKWFVVVIYIQIEWICKFYDTIISSLFLQLYEEEIIYNEIVPNFIAYYWSRPSNPETF